MGNGSTLGRLEDQGGTGVSEKLDVVTKSWRFPSQNLWLTWEVGEVGHSVWGKPSARVSLGWGSPQRQPVQSLETGPELREFGDGLSQLLPTHQRATSAFCLPRRALSRGCPLAAVPSSLPLRGCLGGRRMAGGITYADLRFARSPPEESHGEEPNEGELTYENLQVPRGQEKEAAECGTLKNTPELPCWATSCHHWRPVTNRPMLGALALCLFLLATNITLGVQYLQASRQLQQASRSHAAKSLFLGERAQHLQAGLEESRHLLRLTEQELNSTKKELNSTKKELNSTTVALWQSWAAENQSRLHLQHQELLLGQANRSLALLQRQRGSLEVSLSQASSCRQIGCCPRKWTLFRWKCLWVSRERKPWWQSKSICEKMSSRLLVLPEPWSVRELWEAVGEAFTQMWSSSDSNSFWVGLQRDSKTGWKWVDGSPYQGSETSLNKDYYYSQDSYYAVMHNGLLSSQRSSSWYRFICERAASPEDSPDNGL